jgi:endoribonuclease Dicer
MEGILGALYVSDNCTLEGAEKFFNKVFRPFFDEFVTFEMLVRHAADAVLEMLNRLGCRQYSSVRSIENGVHTYKSEFPSSSPTGLK